MKGKREGLLNGISVLDLADCQGNFCSKLLADLGALVIKAEDPEQGRGRKKSFRRLIQTADVLVESFRPGHLKSPDLDYRRLRRINPLLIHLSITGFGQSGPKSAYHACDSVLAAFGGQMYVCGMPSGRPLKLFGPQSCYAASLFGANAVLLNLRKRKITGKGCHIDLSIQEAVASTLDQVLIDYCHNGIAAGRQGDEHQREPFSALRCKDGYVQIPILRNWETLLELASSEGCAKALLENKWQDAAYRRNHYSQIVDLIESWTRHHTKTKLFELGQAMAFPWAPVQSPEEVLKSPQLKARRFFIRAAPAAGNRSIPTPGLPFKFSPASASANMSAPLLKDQRAASHPAKSGDILRGIRVLDFTRMLSGPYATRILGDFGAEVVKVQSRLTASGAEENDTPTFCAWNRNKRSISLDLNRPEAREILMELVSTSDVVVENFSPRVMANWELSYERLKVAKPDLIMASISAMGQTGPWKNYVGFAPTFHALSGLTSATSLSLDAPTGIRHAYGDVVAGLYAALGILAAIDHRDRTGRGQYIDLSAYEALCTLMGPAWDTRQFNNRNNAAPCGCYPCKGSDRWCVIAVFDEAEWQAFCRISKQPVLNSARFSTQARRRRNREELDTLIGEWTTRRTAETVVRRLQKAGIASGVVQNAADLARDSQLAARHFFVSLPHPVIGKSYSDRSALWPWDEKHEHWRAAPSLGGDNHYVIVELLGRSELEFETLVAKGIID